MRYKEIISEANGGKLSKREQQATAGLHTYDDGPKLGTFGSDYGQYRLMMALACSDGKTPIDMDSLSWIGKKKQRTLIQKLNLKCLNRDTKLLG